ncbi:MAG: hypothetical protein NVSMB19_23790 [Vulcanimicrobiaceae bacterium]
MRQIAASAGVDAALVHHYFGTKRALFEAALAIADLGGVAPLAPLAAPTRPARELPGDRIVRDFLTTWDAPGGRATIAGLLRTAGAEADARSRLAELFARTVVVPATGGIDARRGMAKLRAALVAAQLVGLAWTRYVLGTEPIASASPQILGRTFGASIDATLHGIDFGSA